VRTQKLDTIRDKAYLYNHVEGQIPPSAIVPVTIRSVMEITHQCVKARTFTHVLGE
jgi:hypothetical protein